MPVFTSSIELSDDYPSIQPSLNLNFAGSRALDPHITFTRDSVGTYVDKNGLIKTAGEDEARFDHDPETLESLGLLIEEGRTNLIAYSVINTANWNNSTSTVTNNTTETKAPDGSNTAFKYVPDNGGIGWVSVYNTADVINVISGTEYSYSIWAKPTHSDYTGFRINGDIRDNPGIAISANFVLSGDGSVSGTYDSASITKYPNGWYRCVATATADATTTEEPGFQTTASGDGTKGFYAWGYQVEAGVFPTSYIPTSAAAVTRAVDTATITGTSFSDFYNQNEGTLVSFSRTLGVDLYQTATFEFTSSNVNAELIGLEVTNSYNRFYVYGGGASASNYNYSVVSAGTLTKNALAYKLNDVAGVRDGGTVFNDTSAGIPIPNIDRATIGYNFGYGNQKQQHIDRLLYYPKRLTDAQLQLLTS